MLDLENIEKNIAKNVEKHGYYVLLFAEEEGEPAYGHTVGLYQNYNHPEVVLFGLDFETLEIMLSEASERVKAGEKIAPDKPDDTYFEGYSIVFTHANVDEYKGYFMYGIDYNDGHEFPALQMVWPDQKKRFPWEEQFNEQLLPKQPLLM